MSGADGQGLTLRYRPVGGGYRREDVEAALTKLLETAVRRAEAVLNQVESN